MINTGSKWKSKSVVVEVGVKPKSAKTWRWSRVGTSRTDVRGATLVCSSRTLMKGNQLRVRVGKVEIAKVNISRNITLSGCGYVAPSAPSITASPAIAVATPAISSPATTPTQSVATTAPPTTVPPTTVPPTTAPPVTTLPPSTPAPTALALSSVSDTGDSQSDGITNATTLVVEGSAEVNSSVQIYVNGTASGSGCTANGSGVFACTLGTVSEGNHAITARATANALESSSSATYNIVVDRTKPTVTWNPNGILLIGANDQIQVALTISEVTTDFLNGDIRMICTIQDGCAVENFSGTGRNYSLTFRTIDNKANGGFVSLFANVFSDVAGNLNDASNGVTIMYDTAGPRPTLSTENGLIIITFSEIPVGFTRDSLSLSFHSANQKLYSLGAGVGINTFGTYGSSGRSWRFTVNDGHRYWQDDERGEYYLLEVGSVADVDENITYPEELSWP